MKVEIEIPDALRPATRDLVAGFAAALAAKLTKAQERRAADLDNRERDEIGNWKYECNRSLLEHVGKGDPLDVAAYAAFAWKLKYRTSLGSVMSMLRLDEGLN